MLVSNYLSFYVHGSVNTLNENISEDISDVI